MAEKQPEKTEAQIFKRLSLVILIILAALWLAAISSILLMNPANAAEGTMAERLADKDWPSVMRLCAVFWAAAFLLIFTSFWRSKTDGDIIRKKGVRWHVEPDVFDDFCGWIDRYYHSVAGFDSGQISETASDKNSFRILKEYRECSVLALAGWIVKEYRPKPGWKSIRFAIMPTRARRGFISARNLATLGIPTPQAIAWGIKRSALFAKASYVITRELKDSLPLTEWLENNRSDQAIITDTLSEYGKLMAMFHANEYSNRDFKHENVMCSKTPPHTLHVIDLDGVSRKWKITRKRAEKDLMRVGSSLADLGFRRTNMRHAFFNAYNKLVPQRLKRDDFPGH